MIDTDNVKGKYCSKQEMIFYLNAVEEVERLRELLATANERARLAIESHPNADEMLKELIE